MTVTVALRVWLMMPGIAPIFTAPSAMALVNVSGLLLLVVPV